MYIKKFFEWLPSKKNINESIHSSPFVSEGEIWWVHFGVNVGSEIDGKGSRFSRPALIYKKLARHFYLIIPTTTAIKEGSWYVKFTHKQKEMCVCLHQIRVVDYRRLTDKLGEIDGSDSLRIKEAFNKLYN
jgi:mRNA interferase MazF